MHEAIAENAPVVADYKAGSERALNFIVGQVMKKIRGKSYPGEVRCINCSRLRGESKKAEGRGIRDISHAPS